MEELQEGAQALAGLAKQKRAVANGARTNSVRAVVSKNKKQSQRKRLRSQNCNLIVKQRSKKKIGMCSSNMRGWKAKGFASGEQKAII